MTAMDFAERARKAFGGRRIIPYTRRGEDFTGDNIFWQSNSIGRNSGTALHADKNCHLLPDGSLKAYPESMVDRQASRHVGYSLCPYCTAWGDSK